jgi:DNA-binding NarL/FixJ family response regulator
MLTAAAGAVCERSARVDVESVVVRLALLHITEGAGWATCDHTDRDCSCARIADRCPSEGRVSVLVVRDEPAACQDAIAAIVQGRAGSIVLWNEPGALPIALDAIAERSTLVPTRVFDLASEAPQVSDRQRRVLRLMAAGRSNQAIAQSLRQSLSTVKRDVAELLDLFDVPNRAALISASGALGFTHRDLPGCEGAPPVATWPVRARRGHVAASSY